jgi:hypothetical protein
MAIKVMIMVFEAGGLTPPQKAVLLALADCGNDDGRSIYPSAGTLAKKTAYSERRVRLALAELREAELIKVVNIHRQHKTTDYCINIEKLRSMHDPYFEREKPAQNDGQTCKTCIPGASRPEQDAPLDQTPDSRPASHAPMTCTTCTSGDSDLHQVPFRPASGAPEPLINRELKTEPSEEREREEAPDESNSLSPQSEITNDCPEIQVFFQATGRFPQKDQVDLVADLIRAHGFTVDYLRPFWQEWRIARRYSPENLGWLNDWAIAGEIPSKNGKSPRRVPRRNLYAIPDPFPTDSNEPDSSDQASDVPKNPTIDHVISGSRLTPAQAWKAVIGQLETEMPRSAFWNWVEGARLINFIPDRCCFIVEAETDFNRLWLESRLTSTLTRLLTGICNSSVEIKFIAGALEPDNP